MSLSIGAGWSIGGGFAVGAIDAVVGAWSFNGANDLQILDFTPYTGNTTFEMWIRPTGSSTSPVWWMPVDYVSPSNYNKLQWRLDGSTLTAQNIPFAGGASTFTPISATLNLDAWNYVCFAVVSGVAILYVNGVRVGSSSASNYTYQLNAWYVGYDTQPNPDEFFTGQLTNIRLSNADIYNLAALPSTMPVPTGQLTVQGTTLVLYTMSNPTADISNETDSTGNASTNASSPPTWIGSNPGPY
jgi:hypothetical protein